MSPLDFDPRNDGYWGDTTATLDWCEQNYEVRKCHSHLVLKDENPSKKLHCLFKRHKWNPDSWTGSNPLILVDKLVHRWVLEHCDQPVYDHTSNLGHLHIPPGDSKRAIFFTASNEIASEETWISVPGELFGTSARGHRFHHVPHDFTVGGHN